MPAVSDFIDWEAELAVVIGNPARNVKAEDALDYIAGYTIFNDLSARDIVADRFDAGAMQRTRIRHRTKVNLLEAVAAHPDEWSCISRNRSLESRGTTHRIRADRH